MTPLAIVDDVLLFYLYMSFVHVGTLLGESEELIDGKFDDCSQ